MRQSVKGSPRSWHTHQVVRTKPADQRREELLDAAQASFLERGIAATTVDHIAAGAGVAKGTFYLYFRSRADVLTAVQRRYGDRFVAQLVAAIAEAGDDWGAKLDGCVRVGLQNHQVERALHDVLFISAPPERGPELDHALDDLIGVFQRLLADGVAAGAYDVDDIDTTAVLLFNTLHGVFNPIWLGASPLDEDRLTAAARTLFRRTVNYQA
jgi:AcrR family transcriptional regulator